MRNVLIYVAGPISKGNVSDNIARAHAAGIALLKAGIPAIVPHGSCFWGNRTLDDLQHGNGDRGAFAHEVLPSGTLHDDWYQMDLVIVSKCSAVLCLSGESKGADLEVLEAQRLGKPVFYNLQDAIDWARAQEEYVPAPAPLPPKLIFEQGPGASMQTPPELAAHQQDYQPDAWKRWGWLGLLLWEYLLRRRAVEHRVPGAKKDKDIQDANNYRAMRQEWERVQGRPPASALFGEMCLLFEDLEAELVIQDACGADGE